MKAKESILNFFLNYAPYYLLRKCLSLVWLDTVSWALLPPEFLCLFLLLGLLAHITTLALKVGFEEPTQAVMVTQQEFYLLSKNPKLVVFVHLFIICHSLYKKNSTMPSASAST